ncbi:Glutathione S-transferase [Granulibacter bethesdensis]|nr:Glutathione S-transferase [Granulibacter bethesdensis]
MQSMTALSASTRARLLLGTRRYSSWSLRGWLAVKLAGIEAEEVVYKLAGGHTPEVKQASPSGCVPVLEVKGQPIWDSLAICEYCAEIQPALWPSDSMIRAQARSLAAEMHSGFRELRIAMPMNVCRRFPGLMFNEAVLADLARIDQVWSETRARFGADGPYLYGAALTVADIMYAPVVARFLTYDVPLSEAAASYRDAVRMHPLMQQWYAAAEAEPESWHLPKYEQIV